MIRSRVLFVSQTSKTPIYTKTNFHNMEIVDLNNNKNATVIMFYILFKMRGAVKQTKLSSCFYVLSSL